jgi:S-adenosylmethionine synthetase
VGLDLLRKRICEVFPLSPSGIIDCLDLRKPIFGATSAYGHFGRDGFLWERTDRAGEFRRLLR